MTFKDAAKVGGALALLWWLFYRSRPQLGASEGALSAADASVSTSASGGAVSSGVDAPAFIAVAPTGGCR